MTTHRPLMWPSWPEVELTAADAVALGRFLERLRRVEHKVRNRQVSRKDTPTSSALLLAALRRSPLARRQLLRVTGLRPHVVSSRLSDLGKRGLVAHSEDGTWRLVAEEEG